MALASVAFLFLFYRNAWQPWSSMEHSRRSMVVSSGDGYLVLDLLPTRTVVGQAQRARKQGAGSQPHQPRRRLMGLGSRPEPTCRTTAALSMNRIATRQNLARWGYAIACGATRGDARLHASAARCQRPVLSRRCGYEAGSSPRCTRTVRVFPVRLSVSLTAAPGFSCASAVSKSS